MDSLIDAMELSIIKRCGVMEGMRNESSASLSRIQAMGKTGGDTPSKAMDNGTWGKEKSVFNKGGRQLVSFLQL